MSIIQRLQKYRLENKITQEELATRLGVNFTTISRWLNGHTKPRQMQEYQIEKLLNRKQARIKN
jgi:transcriptional regulator with XRE-family HTH domain